MAIIATAIATAAAESAGAASMAAGAGFAAAANAAFASSMAMSSVLMPVLVVGGVVAAAGAIISGSAAASQAKGQQAIANYNAKVSERNAQYVEQQAAYKQKLQAQDNARRQSTLEAGLAASGAAPAEGTPLLLQSQQASQGELEMMMTGYQGQIGADQSRSQAAIDRAQASIYGTQAGYAVASGVTGAGTSLLKGFGKAYGGE